MNCVSALFYRFVRGVRLIIRNIRGQSAYACLVASKVMLKNEDPAFTLFFGNTDHESHNAMDWLLSQLYSYLVHISKGPSYNSLGWHWRYTMSKKVHQEKYI